MSLINEVLNRLEQRGEHTAPNQTEVRAVVLPSQRDWRWGYWALLIAALLTAAAWGWLRQPSGASGITPAIVVPIRPLSHEIPQEVSMALASKLSYELSAVALPETMVETEEAMLEPVLDTDKSAAVRATLKPSTVADVVPRKNEEMKHAPVALTDMPLKQVSQAQQAEAEFRKASVLRQQGHQAEALVAYENALRLNAQLDAARLAQAALLAESHRGADAERVLQEGLKMKPLQLSFSMALGRIQVERGNIEQAISTLERNLAQAEDKADYQAFYAALLQRQGRHKEAINHYQIATQLVPDNGLWQMGFGISLQEVQRAEDAKLAYQRALASKTLKPALTAFVQQKLQSL